MDPLAALGPSPIEVEVGSWVYTVPARSARDWIEEILSERGGAIFPGLLEPDDRDDVTMLMLTGQVEAEEIRRCAQDLLSEASGRDWWEADRLIRTATQERVWPILSGELAMAGMNLGAIGIAEFANAVWVAILRRCKDDDEVMRVELELRSPPGGIDPDEVFSDDEAEADFLAAHQGG